MLYGRQSNLLQLKITMSNENQKPVTDEYRNQYDSIFKKPKPVPNPKPNPA